LTIRKGSPQLASYWQMDARVPHVPSGYPQRAKIMRGTKRCPVTNELLSNVSKQSVKKDCTTAHEKGETRQEAGMLRVHLTRQVQLEDVFSKEEQRKDRLITKGKDTLSLKV